MGQVGLQSHYSRDFGGKTLNEEPARFLRGGGGKYLRQFRTIFSKFIIALTVLNK